MIPFARSAFLEPRVLERRRPTGPPSLLAMLGRGGLALCAQVGCSGSAHAFRRLADPQGPA
eukprot:8893821-Alexandrium_andersonii.AAC.1